MTELLFHTPWWLPTLIIAAGIVVFITGNKRVENRVRLAGIGIVVLGVVVMAVSYFVETPLEKAERRTSELVTAFEKADWAKFSSILDPATNITVLGEPVYRNRDDIVAAAKKAHSQHGFKSLKVLTRDAVQADTVITVSLFLLSEQDTLGRTLNSRWEFEWQNSADGWALVSVRAVQIGNVTGEQMRGMFPR